MHFVPWGEKVCFVALATGIFLSFGWGVKNHFRSEKLPFGMLVVSISSLIAYFIYAYVFLFNEATYISTVLGATMQIVGAIIFALSIKQTSERRLSLAYDTDKPLFIITSGPYMWIRHPFYLSYIMYWVGCSVATYSMIVAIAAALLFGLYLIAALREENKFENSDLRDDYRQYRTRAGLFWPKFGRVR